MPESVNPVHFRCWTCLTSFEVRGLASQTEPLNKCCYDTLTDLGQAFNTANLRQLLAQIPRLKKDRVKFNNALADAAILSPDPAVRAAAIKWRNQSGNIKTD
jgi:hypothetical protein